MHLIKDTDFYTVDGENEDNWISTKPGKESGALDYQLDRIIESCKYVKKFEHVIDVGANIGLIANQLATRFKRVTCFEPSREIYKCLKKNTKRHDNVFCHNIALGNHKGHSGLIKNKRNSGATCININGNECKINTLDSFRFHTTVGCDFLKLDIQGYEFFALLGGQRLIEKCKPIIMLEEEEEDRIIPDRYGINRDTARVFLQGLGYKVLTQINHDYIMGIK